MPLGLPKLSQVVRAVAMWLSRPKHIPTPHGAPPFDPDAPRLPDPEDPFHIIATYRGVTGGIFHSVPGEEGWVRIRDSYSISVNGRIFSGNHDLFIRSNGLVETYAPLESI